MVTMSRRRKQKVEQCDVCGSLVFKCYALCFVCISNERGKRIRELEADKAKIQKEFDRLLIRDTKNLQRLINAQAQLEAVTDILYGSKHADIDKLEQIEAAIGDNHG
jgi:hypothetical protein